VIVLILGLVTLYLIARHWTISIVNAVGERAPSIRA